MGGDERTAAAWERRPLSARGNTDRTYIAEVWRDGKDEHADAGRPADGPHRKRSH